MKSAKSNILEGKTDRFIRENIRQYYHDIVYKYNFKLPVYIRLNEKSWYSTNTLNLILVFIEAILSDRSETKIYVDLFSKNFIDSILRSKVQEDQPIIDGEPITEFTINAIISKIIFYDSTNFLETLYEYGVNVSPSPNKYDSLRSYLRAFIGERKWTYSSKMLPLSKLIETELEQRSLSNRISTMANILYRNLFGRLTPDEAKRDSEQIMYELVKNIYQHSVKKPEKIIKNSGFACAQIIRIPLLNTPKIDNDLIKALLYKEWKTVKKTWRFLSITINDFGVGLANKVRSDLLNRKDSTSMRISQLNIDDEFIKSDWNLMLLAATTDYTSKTFKHDEQFLGHKLESKGFGFIFCLSFIAKNLGRMEICSGSSKIIFIAKPEAYLADFWNNVGVAAKKLHEQFETYFETKKILLSDEESIFPGTQMLIEIPVEVFA